MTTHAAANASVVSDAKSVRIALKALDLAIDVVISGGGMKPMDAVALKLLCGHAVKCAEDLR